MTEIINVQTLLSNYSPAYYFSWAEAAAGMMADPVERSKIETLRDEFNTRGQEQPIRLSRKERLVLNGMHRIIASKVYEFETIKVEFSEDRPEEIREDFWCLDLVLGYPSVIDIDPILEMPILSERLDDTTWVEADGMSSCDHTVTVTCIDEALRGKEKQVRDALIKHLEKHDLHMPNYVDICWRLIEA